MTELEALDRVVKETINSIEKGKESIFDIAETARDEAERVKKELLAVKQETLATIQEVDRCRRLEKNARLRLMEVSRDFHRHSEEVIKEAYSKAQDAQIRLLMLEEKEKNLRQRRDELERSLRRLTSTVEKAEILVTQIGVVLQFLQGTLSEINLRLEGLQRQQHVGVRVIKALEEERQRIAREIHDGPAQSLANIVLRAELCEQILVKEPDRVKSELTRLKGLARESLQDIRKIIFDLRPVALNEKGLVGVLSHFLADFKERYGVRVDFYAFGQERRFNPSYEVGLFRIIQEALNNVVKHAQASSVVVKLEFLPGQVVALIKDNGKGFEPEAVASEGGHYGLMIMRERAQLMNGEIQISSSPGQGTDVTITIPVEEESRGEGDSHSHC